MAEKLDDQLYWYRAKVLRVVDGDTLVVEIDKGMRDRSEESIRVAGVDTPELFSGVDTAAGAEARAFTVEWVAAQGDDRWPIRLRTHKDARTFDRYVADVYGASTGESLADALAAAGWAWVVDHRQKQNNPRPEPGGPPA